MEPDPGRAAWMAALFVGESDEGGVVCTPCYSSRLAEAACSALMPSSFEEVCEAFYPGRPEEDVPARAWESMRLGYARYTGARRRARRGKETARS